MSLYECFIDGAVRNNGMKDRTPEAACASIIYCDRKEIARFARPLGVRTNNQAEYEALINCLLMCRSMGNVFNPNIYSDSKVVVNQMTDVWAVKEESLVPFYLAARELATDYNFQLILVPRKKVFLADDLCNKCLNRTVAVKNKMSSIKEQDQGLYFNEQ